MGDASPTPSTVGDFDADGLEHSAGQNLNLQSLPPVFVIPYNISEEDLRESEDALFQAGAPLTFDEKEAQLFLGKVEMTGRAKFELRKIGVWTESTRIFERSSEQDSVSKNEPQGRKRKRDETQIPEHPMNNNAAVLDSSTDSEEPPNADKTTDDDSKAKLSKLSTPRKWPKDVVAFIKFSWLNDCLVAGSQLPFDRYLVFEGTRVQKPTSPKTTSTQTSPTTARKRSLSPTKRAENILDRARADESAAQSKHTSTHPRFRGRRSSHSHTRRVPLLHRSTTDEEAAANIINSSDQPDWVRKRSTFSCERVTLLHGPNEDFVNQLKLIRTARKLTNDMIGVRAYSTSIAAIAAYPRTITSRLEILALPGCDAKIGALWAEWHERDGVISTIQDIENDEKMKVLRLFYEIWGVGALTAQDYYNRGWRDLDDIVEYGWSSLPRVIQIGVKFYDEFQLKIPRDECEAIEQVIIEHLKRIRDPEGVRTCIVGGYRRGKELSGDVDVIISHTTEHATMNLVEDLVQSLLEEGWVTHELITYASGTRREQNALQFRQDGGGHGFDTLDKALCVWHNPHLPDDGDVDDEDEPTTSSPNHNDATDTNDTSPNAKSKKHTNPHRRVDIICATWSRIGCAVLGWTADTTFERDLRRYAKYKKGWKFDSSGVRSRATGREIDVQGPTTSYETVEEAERKVFESFGLEWREPWERCTG